MESMIPAICGNIDNLLAGFLFNMINIIALDPYSS